MLFKQIRYIGDNFSYIIADESSREAIVVDPSFNAQVIIQFIQKKGLCLKYIVNTHHHRDHVAGNEKLQLTCGAKVIAHRLAMINKDIEINDGDRLMVGKIVVDVLHTPGHTPGSICLLVDNKLLTGDTLFVGGCGRVDLPGGSVRDLYNSLFNKLIRLDDSTEVYPGHDYGSRSSSTIGVEKKTNIAFKKRALKDFIFFMSP